MSESAPIEHNPEDPSQPPRNYSVYSTSGELIPAPDTRYPFNHYKDSKDGNEYFHISELGNDNEKQPRQKQIVVAQLASLIMPVAPVFKKYSEQARSTEFFSADVKRHPDYNDKEKHISPIDYALLYTLFDDYDHSDLENYEGGILYDFGNAKFHDEHDYAHKYRADVINTAKKESAEMLEAKTAKFKASIAGADGLEFITNVCKHAGYTEVTPEEIQSTLLKRVQVIEDLLRK